MMPGSAIKTRRMRRQLALQGGTPPPALGDPVAGAASWWHGLRAEWIRIRTMRSTLYVVLGTLLFGAGLAALTGTSAGTEYAALAPADRAAFDPVAISLRGYLLAQVTLGMLGALVITAEYGTRTIVATLTATPRRGRVLAAKAVVLTAAALPAGLLVTVSGFLVGQAALASADAPHTDLADPAAARAVLGGGVFLALIALLGLSAGVLLRSTTATVTTLFGTLLIVPAFVPALPGRLAAWATAYWPPSAGAQITTSHRDPDLLAPWAGFALLGGFVAVLFVAASVTFRRRDA